MRALLAARALQMEVSGGSGGSSTDMGSEVAAIVATARATAWAAAWAAAQAIARGFPRALLHSSSQDPTGALAAVDAASSPCSPQAQAPRRLRP